MLLDDDKTLTEKANKEAANAIWLKQVRESLSHMDELVKERSQRGLANFVLVGSDVLKQLKEANTYVIR